MGCPSGWKEVSIDDEARCLIYAGDEPVESAISICKEIGGTVPIPRSAKQNAHYRAGFVSVGATKWVHIGINDIETENHWRDTEGDPIAYFNWNTGEPNNKVHSFSNADFAEMDPS